jgi:NADP-dependent 3-hydroxy acid dehydrogenase YdfG
MTNDFAKKVAVVFGATGGLGQAIVKALHTLGTTVIAVGRDKVMLQKMSLDMNGLNYQIADITQSQDIQAVYVYGLERFGRIDIVINASGFDVRKPLINHTQADIERTLAVNLYGTILITQLFLQLHTDQYDAVIMHLGGFADGRLAFPFYSVNVASRSAIYAFVESVNREMHVLERRLAIKYFGPTSANTLAEQPFHSIWRQMGMTIAEPETIAQQVVYALFQPQSIYTMGLGARLLTTLNAISPRLANFLIMNRYSKILASHLNLPKK